VVPLRILTCFAYAVAILGSALGGRAHGLEVEFTSRPVKRDLLALYDSRVEAVPAATRIHRFAEMPLNWLGYKLTYVDVNGTLPAPTAMEAYRGIVSWLIEPLASPLLYTRWLDQATASGLRLAAIGEVAPGEGQGDPDASRHVMDRLGLIDADQFVNVTYKVKPLTLDREMVGFERPLDKVLPPFPIYVTASSATRVYLSLSVPDSEGLPSSAVVATSPGGGYAADPYAVFYDAASDRARWVINPFLFFRRALGEERFPVPDVTTLAGRRIYFSHIDGDGWNNVSEIEGYRELQASAAEVIRREVIEPFPDLPVTVGLIAGDALPELGGAAAARETAAKLFALAQVEVASHTYSHPFAWGFFENYSREAELALIENEAHPAQSAIERVRGFLYRVAGRADSSEAGNRYVSGGGGLPRSYLKEPFDLTKEVESALSVSNELAPKSKKAAIYLWSGDTEPFEGAIKAARGAGVRNMNGGDTRFDAEYPSVAYVPPIARPVGRERQIYAGNSNENTYTNNWHGPYWGQLLLAETLKNTEAPRRLKPFNLYYHMYSGEKPASLAAVRTILGKARLDPVVPIKASEYAAIADSFFDVATSQTDAMTWLISNRGALQTFRFDDATGLDVDYRRSQGVLGSKMINGALYVALDAAIDPAAIALATSRREPGPETASPPRLVDSRWQVSNAGSPDACHFSFRAIGYGAGDMTWRVEPERLYDIRMTRAGSLIESSRIAADRTGQLALALSANAIDAVTIEIECHEP